MGAGAGAGTKEGRTLKGAKVWQGARLRLSSDRKTTFFHYVLQRKPTSQHRLTPVLACLRFSRYRHLTFFLYFHTRNPTDEAKEMEDPFKYFWDVT